MPKPVSITKALIDDAAVAMVRQDGLDALTARNIAQSLHCSTQPIYKVYGSMEKLKESTMNTLARLMMQCIMSNQKTGSAFLNSGLGYIHFAQTEKNLFQLLCLQNKNHNILKADVNTKPIRTLMEQELEDVPLPQNARDNIFLQTMIFTYGLASLAFLDQLYLNEDEISALLEKTFKGYITWELEGENV